MKNKYSEEFIKEAHKHTIFNYKEIKQSKSCTCFYCGYQFNPNIKEEEIQWTDEDNPKGLTILCPMCGIDCVIGNASGYPIDDLDFIFEASESWFNGYSRISDGKKIEKVKWTKIDVD